MQNNIYLLIITSRGKLTHRLDLLSTEEAIGAHTDNML